MTCVLWTGGLLCLEGHSHGKEPCQRKDFPGKEVNLVCVCVCVHEFVSIAFQQAPIIIIIIAFKGAIRDFLQSPCSATNCLQHIRSSGPGAVVCKSRAAHQALITWKCHVTCHLVRRGSSAINWQSWNRIYLSFILLAEPLNYLWKIECLHS